MRVVFMGTGEFAVPTLKAVHAEGHDIALVVSQPDRPQGRGLSLRPSPIKVAAERLGLPTFQPEKLWLEPESVVAQKAEILVVVAYGQILREEALECATRGAINVHASLLPRYRGAAPIQWAIANGETETGVTTMRLDRGMDTGPILLQRVCAIDPEDTTASLEPRLAALGATLLVNTLAGLANGSLEEKSQNEALATRAPLIRKSDGAVDFTQPARSLKNRLRGFSPWPGVRFRHEGRSIRILAATTTEAGATAVPGAILGISRDGLDVACDGGSVLRLLRVQPESRGPMSAFEFANGAKLRAGTVFAEADPPAPPHRSIAAKD